MFLQPPGGQKPPAGNPANEPPPLDSIRQGWHPGSLGSSRGFQPPLKPSSKVLPHPTNFHRLLLLQAENHPVLQRWEVSLLASLLQVPFARRPMGSYLTKAFALDSLNNPPLRTRNMGSGPRPLRSGAHFTPPSSESLLHRQPRPGRSQGVSVQLVKRVGILPRAKRAKREVS